ncbi:MAG: DUF2442 domain-containing protein [Ignavibacteriae bacterium]|nr:DUF2442 domain-containing protein [Ignavibacteriota bacterium]
MKNLKILSAKYLIDYKIFLTFNDGKSGEVNLENDLWGKIFLPLKDISNFIQFKISPVTNTIEWPNGADLAPEYLYSKCE